MSAVNNHPLYQQCLDKQADINRENRILCTAGVIIGVALVAIGILVGVYANHQVGVVIGASGTLPFVMLYAGAKRIYPSYRNAAKALENDNDFRTFVDGKFSNPTLDNILSIHHLYRWHVQNKREYKNTLERIESEIKKVNNGVVPEEPSI